MDKVDIVLVGSEAVVESGGLINAVGSNQIAIIANAAKKPFYAMAERLVQVAGLFSSHCLMFLLSYKFHRLFPLSQYDLPTHTPDILSFPRITTRPTPGVLVARPSILHTPTSPRTLTHSAYSSKASNDQQLEMTPEQIKLNPEVDYTRFVRCDLSSLCLIFTNVFHDPDRN